MHGAAARESAHFEDGVVAGVRQLCVEFVPRNLRNFHVRGLDLNADFGGMPAVPEFVRRAFPEVLFHLEESLKNHALPSFLHLRETFRTCSNSVLKSPKAIQVEIQPFWFYSKHTQKNLEMNCLTKCQRNYWQKIDPECEVQVDRGFGPVTVLYTELVDELKARHHLPKYIYREIRIYEKLEINGIQCQISFFGSHYCGYVMEHIALLNDLAREPHGGWTGGWGFDCAHFDDITLHHQKPFFPYRPNRPIVDSATFKTYEYVVSELEAITRELNYLLGNDG